MSGDVFFRRFRAPVIRAAVPGNTPGVYQLAMCSAGKVIVGYVGRSDTCLRERLITHELLARFDYFCAWPAVDALRAYHLEACMWHLLRGEMPLPNRIHPAAPRGVDVQCPYCSALAQFRRFIA